MTPSYIDSINMRSRRSMRLLSFVLAALLAAMAIDVSSCSGNESEQVQAKGPTITVGVAKVVKKSLGRDITLSSELVPFQEIDVYAKESGYVKNSGGLRNPRKSRAGNGRPRDSGTGSSASRRSGGNQECDEPGYPRST